ncbi:polysaccharide biosynthesis/export family protein [Pseudoroseicyclus aestuarii]|uniref:polysaccharide biosynthesis/export family protein n=1 Tax=Pseudoroseicyclus aestuarii TaxID=1795041 RepID=UPI001FE948F2|nr:polysaccharide biosynthesis/export family protein [Pseudoroseicyclus aestuarii]
MTPPFLRLPPLAGALAALALLASCGLVPRAGPSRGQIFDGSVMRQGDAFVVTVDDRVNAIAGVVPALGVAATLEGAGVIGSDTIRPGDVLGLTIWENVETGLLVPTGTNAAVLEEVQVDGDGFIFVPYAGRLRAAGQTPEALRRLITTRLETQTPDPQVQVRRTAGDGATVSVAGGVVAQGVYPIDRPTRTLSAMIAAAGGVSVEPELARVTVTRGGTRGSLWLEDLYTVPGADIALRGGDRILVSEDDRSFTALGATLRQTEMPFSSRTISAIEAIAQVGGLNPNSADPTGVFVFRNEPAEIASQLVGIEGLTGPQRVVYVLDLTRPNGMFTARDFAIRDEDTVYVTEAPIVEFNKVIGAVTGTLTSTRAATDGLAE